MAENKKLLQHSQLSQHGEFRHVSDSNHVCVVRIFVGPSYDCTDHTDVIAIAYMQPMSKRAIEQWRPTKRQKRLYLHQGEFQLNYCVVVLLHHSDPAGVVRIFVGHSEVVERLLFNYLRGTIFPIPGV